MIKPVTKPSKFERKLEQDNALINGGLDRLAGIAARILEKHGTRVHPTCEKTEETENIAALPARPQSAGETAQTPRRAPDMAVLLHL